MRKKLRFFFYLTEIEEMVWGSHYIYICARWEIIDGYCFDGERDFLFGIMVRGDLWYQRGLGDDTL